MNAHRAALRIKYTLVFLLLMIVDIGPIPITAALGLYVVLYRPRWFINIVDTLYHR